MNETLKIEKLVYGGDALGRRSNGEVVFVRGGLPGETVDVDVVPKKKGAVKGRLLQVKTPSEHRVTPPCSVFGKCGGCDWQHLAYAEQLAWKTRIVEESLTRLGKFQNPEVLPIIAGEPWQYRNKVQWAVIPGDSPKLGYLEEESHTGIPFETCHIMPEGFHELKNWFEAEPGRLEGLAKVQVQANATGEWLLSLVPDEENETDLSELAESVSIAFRQLAGDERLRHTLGGQKFDTTAESFFQVNLPVAEQMLAYIDMILPEKMDSFLDVYSGVGLFSLHVAPRTRTVLGVEFSETAVELAQNNARLNSIYNARFVSGDAAETLTALEEEFEVALIDPPRKGCDPEVLAALTESVSNQLVYVSCNPSTLARDLKILVEQGWRLGAVQPFDMFPQTYHVESIATLYRD